MKYGGSEDLKKKFINLKEEAIKLYTKNENIKNNNIINNKILEEAYDNIIQINENDVDISTNLEKYINYI
mgnify:CR=1 FL=1